MNSTDFWSYTMRCDACGTECDAGFPKKSSDQDNGLTYENFEATVQHLGIIWRHCRECSAKTRNIVISYEDSPIWQPEDTSPN